MNDAEFKSRIDREMREARLMACIACLLAFAGFVVWAGRGS